MFRNNEVVAVCSNFENILRAIMLSEYVGDTSQALPQQISAHYLKLWVIVIFLNPSQWQHSRARRTAWAKSPNDTQLASKGVNTASMFSFQCTNFAKETI